MLLDVPYTALTPQEGSRVRKIDRMPAKSIFTTPQGDTVLDFGQNMTGTVEITFESVPGKTLNLHCFEVLDARGNVYLDNLRSAKQQVLYHCSKDGRVTYSRITSYNVCYTKLLRADVMDCLNTSWIVIKCYDLSLKPHKFILQKSVSQSSVLRWLLYQKF